MGKRADTVLVIDGLVFVIEFKVGANEFGSADQRLVQDYVLDLKNFHRGSHDRRLVPVLIATAADDQNIGAISWATDNVAATICLAANQIRLMLKAALPFEEQAVKNSHKPEDFLRGFFVD